MSAVLTRRAAVPALGCALAAVLSSCAGPQSGQAVPGTTGATSSPVAAATAAPSRAPVSPSSSAPPTATTATTPTTPTTATTTGAPPAKPAAAGRVVVLDPGHNGGNGSNARQVNRPVPAGRGRTKPCNTTGTATNAGYPEHAFTWDLAVRVRDRLTARGVQVVLTRADDGGVGPCVDRRAAIGNDSGAAAVVSLHADGSTAAGAHGFHVAYSAPPLNAAQGEPSLRLAQALRDGMTGAGLTTATYTGSRGLAARDDLAGLNLSTRPAALVECGNMRDAEEAARLSSPAGRDAYARAIANGILGFLG